MIKRAFDIVASGLGLLALSPFLLLIALAVRLDSPGPSLYRARRVGKDGREFTLYKFRSMVVAASQLGPAITVAGDNRVTRIGRFMRKSKLDELPQLYNVLRGDMSLVGPRPEDPRYTALYTSDQRAVLRVRPGITSPASVYYRHEEKLLGGQDWERLYVEQVLPAKLEIDLEYVRHPYLWRDVAILVHTFLALFK